MTHRLESPRSEGATGSFLDLVIDLDSIYNTYASQPNNDSVETLDSDKNQAPIEPKSIRRYLEHHPSSPPSITGSNQQYHQQFLGSDLEDNSLSNNNSTSNLSSGSFDFNSSQLRPQVVTNSSLNVLINPVEEDRGALAVSLEEDDSQLAAIEEPSPSSPSTLPPPVPRIAVSTTTPTNHTAVSTTTPTNYIAKSTPTGANPIDKLKNIEADKSLSQLLVKLLDEWAAVKHVPDPEDSNNYKVIRRTVSDFKFGKNLGEGSYSTVVLATDKHTSRKYAVKILDKRHIIKEKKVKYVNIEKHALNRLIDRTGIISLYFTFQDKHSLYFVLEYAPNGELLSLIKKYGTLNEDCTRYYGAQLLDAIKYMHDNGVIHRDIKPENILLDDRLRLQVTDFGTARLLEKKSKPGVNADGNEENDLEDYPVDVRAKSFVGTAEYVSPELLESKYCGKPGDIWAFACIIYQMIAGKPPFKGLNEYQTFQKITKLQYAFSAGFPVVIRDLLKQIFVLQPSKRANIPMIQLHYFFQSVNWEDFDLIWEESHPELGPYKMNAKSMMKVPELSKNLSQQTIPQVASLRKINSKNGDASKREKSSKVNAASVAAYVLNKNDDHDEKDVIDDEDTQRSSTASSGGGKGTSGSSNRPNASKKTTATKSRPAADYIPGTNILRPTVNSQAIRTLTSSSRKALTHSSSSSSSAGKPKSKVIEVGPITPLEVAWGSYLKHSDERILKIGPVICHKQATDVFEKKHKGLLHDSPLGWYGSKQMATRQSSSLLTQVVNGSNFGLRGGQQATSSPAPLPSGEYLEEDEAIIDHYAMTNAPKRSLSTASTSSSSTKDKSKSSFILKKLLKSHHNSSNEESGDDDHATLHPLLKPKTCTLLITTHGRVLIFLRDDNETNYKLVTEVKLPFPYIQFKEVISAASSLKFGQKLLPTMGTFAIESCITTFIFEVEKFDVNGYTEALAKSKLNQIEREIEASQPLSLSGSGSSNGKSKLQDSPVILAKASTPVTPVVAPASPNLQSSPYNRGAGQSPRIKSPELQQSKDKQLQQLVGTGNGGLLASRMSKSIKRKPPPSVYPSGHSMVDMSTGLGSISNSAADNGTLHAAQLAVANNERNRPQSDYQQRTSFTKDEGGYFGSRNTTSSQPTNGNKPAGAITSLNSKFLSRSQRKK